MPDSSILIIGNLTREPELRFTQGGRAVCNFSLAVNHRYQDGGEWKDAPTTFKNCVAWGRVAEHIGASASKGTRLIVHGFLQTRGWTDKDGQDRTSEEVNAQEVGLSLAFTTYERTTTTTRSAVSPERVERWQRDRPDEAPRQQADPIYSDEEPF